MLEGLFRKNQLSESQAENEFIKYLEKGSFKLVRPFNEKGRQAYLASSDVYKMVVLAFRGTEADIKDIKADLKATYPY